MMTIWKYRLEFGRSRPGDPMPRKARVLHVAEQGGQLFAWAEVDPDWPADTVFLRVVGTGHEAPNAVHVGTILQDESVWHVYDIRLETLVRGLR